MGKFPIAALAALFLVFPAQAAEVLSGPYPARVLRVIDGDTFEAHVRIWLGIDLTISVRIAGIDAPELRSRCGEERTTALAARDFLAGLLGKAPVRLSDIRFGKYARRVVATVHLPSGEDVGARLVDAGHALPAGHGRMSRCQEASE